MKKANKVVWGIIGAGDVCEVKSAPAMYKTFFSEVKTVMRRDGLKAADYAKRHGISNWTTNLDEVLNDDEINAIYIATPPNMHAELTIKAAKAGKAVYVEKPMANSHAECLKMIEACKKANVPLFVAYYRRTLRGFLKVKEIVEQGKLGDIRFVNIEMNQSIQPGIIAGDKAGWRVDPEMSGGYFHDLASHQLDFLDFLFGKIVMAKGISTNQAGKYQADDIVSATFQFENGVIGSGNWCFSANPVSVRDVIRIVGSKGELSFNTFGIPMIISINTFQGGHEELSIKHTQPIEKHLIQMVVDELRGTGFSPSTGVSGARTNWVMDQITNKL
jgi:predicted dehydrogenase